MASFQALFFILAAIATQTLAQSPAAPAPSPPGPANLTAVLEKGGQFTTFMRLLASTQVDNQIANQLNSSTEGLTIFAPTDNAFQNLKAGTINSLTPQQQVQLVLYHILSKFYTLDNLETISNPVRTQATGQDGGVFSLTITGSGNNQVNVSTGLVETRLNNALRQLFPLAVYQVDMVLLPEELFGAKAPSSSPAGSAPAKSNKGSSSDPKAEGPVVDGEGKGSNGGYGVRSMGMGLVVGVGLATFGFLF